MCRPSSKPRLDFYTLLNFIYCSIFLFVHFLLDVQKMSKIHKWLYCLINGEMCFLHRSQNRNTLLTWLWGENFFLIHHLNVRVCLIRIHTFRHFCEHDKYFMCAIMRRVLLWHNTAFFAVDVSVCLYWMCSAILIPQWNGRPEETETLLLVLFYPWETTFWDLWTF